MPSGPVELHEKWGDDLSATAYLEKRGWKLMPGFVWRMPSQEYKPTAEENSAVDYLFLEWDYGGIIGVDAPEHTSVS